MTLNFVSTPSSLNVLWYDICGMVGLRYARHVIVYELIPISIAKVQRFIRSSPMVTSCLVFFIKDHTFPAINDNGEHVSFSVIKMFMDLEVVTRTGE